MTVVDVLKLHSAYALTVEDYVLLSRSGALNHFAKTELIEGVIVPVNALYTAHARAQRQFFLELHTACLELANGLDVLFEVSISVGPRTMPRPDVVLTRVVPANGPLAVADVALVVEICDTTQEVDFGPKPLLYAAAGVQEYWVADVKKRKLFRHWSPADGSYASADAVDFGQPIAAQTLPGLTVSTGDL